MDYPDPDIIFDQSYFSLNFIQTKYVRNLTETAYSAELSFLEYGYCEDDFSTLVDSEIEKRVKLPKFIWPKTDDYYISGTPVSHIYEVVGLSIVRCNNATYTGTWKTNDEIDDVLYKSYFELALLNTYFDFDDYDKPVKTYLEGFNLYRLIPGTHQAIDIKIKQNQATMNDDLLLGRQTSKEEFFSIGSKTVRMSTERADYSLIFIFFNIDQETVIYERTVYSFLDLLGQIGGVYGVVYIVGAWISQTIGDKVFYNQVISRLYHIKETERVFELDEELKSSRGRDKGIKIDPLSPTKRIDWESKNEFDDAIFSEDDNIKQKDIISRELGRI